MSLRRELNRELDLIEAADEPITPDDLGELYAPPIADQDATELWVAATQEFDRIRAGEFIAYGDRAYPSREGVWPDMSHAEQMVAKYRPALDQFYRASERGGAVRFPVDFSQGYSTLLEHGVPLNIATIVLANEAALKAYQGDNAGSIRAIRAIFGIVRSFENEPVQISQFVRLAHQGTAIRTIEALLPMLSLSDEEVLELRELMRQVDFGRALQISLLGERANAVDLLLSDDPRGTLGKDDDEPQPPPNGRRFARTRDLIFYLRRVRSLMGATHLSGATRQAELILVERELEGFFDSDAATTYPWSNFFLRNICTMIVHCLKCEAHAMTGDTALAALLYRRETGRPPGQLQDLVPDYMPTVPLDPFDGGPLRFRADGQRFVVYSIGPDCADDGGAPFKNLDQPYDIEFRVSYEGD
ncbi:MAG TPA: hypothetical protein VJ783_13605 [Pirellulales bacterium]|nr:hypothetical protein [Pirellulales bacterium]